MPQYFNPGKLFVSGDVLNVDDLRLVFKNLELKFSGGIVAADFQLVSGAFVIPGNLTLHGGEFRGASNVPTGIVNIRSRGVSGIGADETTAIQSALDRIAGDGYAAVFIPAGVYKTSRPIRVPGNMHIFGSGSGTQLVQTNSDGNLPFFRIEASQSYNSAVLIRDMMFKSDSVGENAGIAVDGFDKGILIENVHGQDLRTLVQVSNSKNVKVDTLWAKSCGTVLDVLKCSNVIAASLFAEPATETGVTMTDVLRFSLSGIDIQGSTNGDGVVLSGCRAGILQCSVTQAKRSGVTLSGCAAVTIEASHITDNSFNAVGDLFPGVRFENSANCGLLSSVVNAPHGSSRQTYGIVLDGGSDNTVGSNTLLPNHGPTGAGVSTDPEHMILDKSTRTLEFGHLRTLTI